MDNQVLRILKNNPSEIISAFDLVYTTPNILLISRKNSSKTFEYFLNYKKIKNKKKVQALNDLKIPPAWSNVKISYVDNAHILATGYDEKKRKQYIYNPKWSKIKNQTKFYKMLGFANALPKLRTRVLKDLQQEKFTKSKVLAIVIRLLEESHIRIGNTYYERRNKTYGLSTLRTRHVELFKNKFKLEFTGKRGKTHKITIKNKKLLRLINKCEEIPGWELFQYFDDNGYKHSIDSTMINDYIHETCGDIYSAKDFRTWAASLITFETLLNFNNIKSSKQKEKNIIKAIDEASKALNNTRSVCRTYYVHPQIIESYRKDKIKPYFEMVERITETSEQDLQPNEKALKALIKTYQPNINTTFYEA